MKSNLLDGAGSAVTVALATDELAPDRTGVVNSHTYIGLGIMALAVLIVWLIHRSRA
jgi:hypothetical protein